MYHSKTYTHVYNTKPTHKRKRSDEDDTPSRVTHYAERRQQAQERADWEEFIECMSTRTRTLRG